MTQREREQEVRRRLYHYAAYRREINEYTDDVLHGTPQHDDSGVRGSGISDPAARAGVALADMPPRLQEKKAWVDAITMALNEMDTELQYICIHVYGLTGKTHKKRENKETAVRVAEACSLSRASLYYRLRVIQSTVLYHAAKRGLFE